jgi:hypothetical protein
VHDHGAITPRNESFAGAPVEADPDAMRSMLDMSLQAWLARLKETAEQAV